MSLSRLSTLDAAVHTARPNAKPAPRQKKARQRIRVKATPKAERDRIAEVRQYVFARERGICRCCRLRNAESLHELRARSIGGKVSKRNSVAVCGSGTTKCHGYLQAKQIDYRHATPAGAEGVIYFTPRDRVSADWLHLKFTEQIESPPMRDMEAE